METEIRKAEPDDAVIVSALASATFYEAYVDSDDPRDLAEYVTSNFPLEKCLEEIEDPLNTFLFAAVGGKIVGYAKVRRSSPPDPLSETNAAEVHRLYLFKRFTGRGIGRKLLEACIDLAAEEGFDGIWLGVWDENRQAKRFYEKAGFQKVGEMDFLYGRQSFVNDVMFLRFR